MDTVRCQFAHVGCTESPCHVQSQVQVMVHVPDGSHASRHPVEVAAKVSEAPCTVLFQCVTMQASVVIPDAAVQCPAVYGLADGGIEADVKQAVVWYQVFLAQVLRLLPHAAHACRQFPALPFVGQVAHVVRQRVQLEVQFVFVSALLKLLAAVLLVAHNGFQIAALQVQRVVPDHLVVLYLLEG